MKLFSTFNEKSGELIKKKKAIEKQLKVYKKTGSLHEITFGVCLPYLESWNHENIRNITHQHAKQI